MQTTYNRYHPLLVILYHSNMLSANEMKTIARSTRYRWDQFRHEDYFGAEMIETYIKQFEEIKNVYSRKHLYQSVRILCELSNGYHGILEGLDSKYKVLRENAFQFTDSIKQISKKTGVPTSPINRFKAKTTVYYEADLSFSGKVHSDG